MVFRLKAFFIHLGASFFIVLLMMGLVLKIWYPAPLHSLLGVTDILLLVILVDVVLGPLLTLIVSNPNKKSLKLDLSIIFILQFVAFGYGIFTVAEGRPVWFVFSGDRFEVVQVFEVDIDARAQAPVEYSMLSWTGPKWVGASLPDDVEQRNALLFSALEGGADLAQRPDLYRPYLQLVPQIRERAMHLSQLSASNDAEVVASVLNKWPAADAFLPLYSRSRNAEMAVLLRRDTAEVIAIVDLAPWL